jgi:hypothetical protein
MKLVPLATNFIQLHQVPLAFFLLASLTLQVLMALAKVKC